MRRDMLGHPLAIGDYVVAQRKNYREMVIAVVTRVTPKKVGIVYWSHWSRDMVEEYLTEDVVLVAWDSVPDETRARLEVALQRAEAKCGASS